MAFERLKSFISIFRAPSVSATTPRSLPGGRLSVDTQFQQLTQGLQMLMPFSPDDYWRDRNLDAHTLSKVSPRKLIELLVDLSPDVSKALWDWILFMNPGREIVAYKVGGRETKTVDTKAQAALDEFLGRLHGPYVNTTIVPLDVPLASLLIGMFSRGALFAELVLDETGRMPLDIATPDPGTVSFRRVTEEPRGEVWQIGQWHTGQEFVVLDRPTIFYVPVHPFPGQAQGRSLAAPAIFSTLFLLGTLHDLRRVVAQQGYPRLDIMVDFTKLKDNMPPEITSDASAMQNWIDKVIAQVQTYYASLEPDDAFVHSDAVTMGKPVGTLDSGNFISSIDGLINAIERQVVRALKSMPLLFGINESVTETHANRQWEVHVAGIKAMQHLVENTLERMFTLALQCQGIVADVMVRFAELRAAELMRDAQVANMQTEVNIKQMLWGLISQDEAAQNLVGHKAFGPPLALAAPTTGTGGEATENPEPGSNRWQGWVRQWFRERPIKANLSEKVQ